MPGNNAVAVEVQAPGLEVHRAQGPWEVGVKGLTPSCWSLPKPGRVAWLSIEKYGCVRL